MLKWCLGMSKEYWDDRWKKEDIDKAFLQEPKWIIKTTRKYLHGGLRILEGGCGLGAVVYWLDGEGYNVTGVDYAENTINTTKLYYPYLNVKIQDVRKLDFDDSYFDGYWSLGVIEHFVEGYDKVVKEMGRVIKKGGYLFLTYPYLSPLRKIRKTEPVIKENGNFYYRLLDKNKVKKRFGGKGFRLVCEKPFDAERGLNREFGLCIKNRYFRGIFNRLFYPLCSHMILQVYRRR